MKTNELDYHLPNELIAQQPAAKRSESRLLALDRSTGRLTDSRFDQVVAFLAGGDCLVLNDTQVIPARFFARRATGGRLEGLFLGETSPGTWQVLLKGLRKVKPSERFCLLDKNRNEYCQVEIIDRSADGECLLSPATDMATEAILETIGYAPLPPYIRRHDDPEQDVTDRDRYQTVYARLAGAVAAPTAGLHFTDELIDGLTRAGVRTAYVTLHVGAGTFKPVTAEDLADHQIHAERYSIDETNAHIINDTRRAGGRVIAVGTTSARVLETVACEKGVSAGAGSTRLYIQPGYRFQIVDAMITNFHLPRSTLLALVAAFAGLDLVLTAYRHAIEKRYRFYSYGDAMLIT